MEEYSECKICGEKQQIYVKTIKVCPECIKNSPSDAIQLSNLIHEKNRSVWKLSPFIPEYKNKMGKQCNFCSNHCFIEEDKTGYCGIRKNIDNRLQSVAGKNKALLHTYLDPLPTNCCSTYFCPAGSSNGYPHFSYSPGPEIGYYNLACFLYGCNFSCLGCQNGNHKALASAERYSFDKFVSKVQNNSKISCICWFGGSPEPQLSWALRASRKAVRASVGRILRVCWEWNGAGNLKFVKNAVALSLETGGNAKFDLKFWDPNLSKVFSGVSNEQSFRNFERCFYDFYDKRKEEPVLTATTLLIPTYVDKKEVSGIAQFIAELDKSIPYSLLIFHPDSVLKDFPVTPMKQVKECYQAAKKYLDNVHIGNKNLLGLL
ncbi:MAG: radical SAM protein [Candidatus Hodarchaeales archaeon]